MFQPRNIIADDDVSRSQYFPALDYLRLTLALSVAAYHAGLLPWKLFGELPVQIFFALSGWLIGGILVRSKPSDLPRFYWHRALRIWPPYFAAVPILLSIGLLKDHVTAKWFEFAFYKVTLTFNIFGAPQWREYALAPMQGSGAPFWSIAAEEQFYLVAPFLIMLLPTGRSVVTWTVIALCVLASPAHYNFAAISFGVLAAVARHRFGDWHLTSAGTAAVLLIATGAMLALMFSLNRVFDALIGMPIVLLLARPGNQTKLASLAGGVSFPLYLNHWLGVWLVTAALHKMQWPIGTAGEVAMVAISVAISVVLYALIDVPARRYRDRWFTDRRGAIAAVAAITLVLLGIAGGLYFTIHRA